MGQFLTNIKLFKKDSSTFSSIGKKKSFPVFNLVMFTNQCSKKTHIQTIRHSSHHSSKKSVLWHRSLEIIALLIFNGCITSKREIWLGKERYHLFWIEKQLFPHGLICFAGTRVIKVVIPNIFPLIKVNMGPPVKVFSLLFEK